MANGPKPKQRLGLHLNLLRARGSELRVSGPMLCLVGLRVEGLGLRAAKSRSNKTSKVLRRRTA